MWATTSPASPPRRRRSTTDQITLTRNSTVEQRRPRLVRRAVRRRDAVQGGQLHQEHGCGSGVAGDPARSRTGPQGDDPVDRGPHRRDVQQRSDHHVSRPATSASTTGAAGTLGYDVLRTTAFGNNATALTTVTTAAFNTVVPNELLLALVGFSGAAGSDCDGRDGRGPDVGPGATHDRPERPGRDLAGVRADDADRRDRHGDALGGG